MSELEPQQSQPEETQPAAPAPQSEPAAETRQEPPAEAPAPAAAEPPPASAPKPENKPESKPNNRPQQERRERPNGGGRPERQPRGERPPQGDKPAGDRPPRADRPERGNDRRPDREGDRRGGPREHGKGPDRGGRPMDPPSDIDLDKLVADSLYLDNAAHAIVARMRDMDSGTRSQLRRLFSAVRRACRASEGDRQHHFVMLRARLAYTIARHQLRSLDPLERLLLQVTRKNDARGYERFRDLFEAIVAYNE